MTEAAAVPTHLGIILDGNRRWATKNNLPTLEGHRKGYENLKDIVKAAIDLGVDYVSAYIFSTENWNRSKEEVSYLMDLALWVAKNEIKELHKNNIRVRFLGSREKLSQKMLKAIDNAEEKTKANDRGTLALCFNYGGHKEIADAVKSIVEKGTKPSDISEQTVADNLYSPDIPPVDLIIRTSGEQRISNFMLWRAAYSELVFVEKHWPAFNTDDLEEAIQEYSRRQRRFGK